MSGQVVEGEVATNRRRKAWTTVAVEDVPSGQTLRAAGQAWLNSRKKIYKTLTASTFQNKTTLIARCKECVDCDQQFSCGWTEAGQLRVEESGKCTGNKNAAVLKRHYAKAFANQTPLRALKNMRLKEISADLRPPVQQIKNYRHMLSSKEKPEAYSVECLGELRAFIDDPSTDVKILTDYVVLSKDRVLLPFCVGCTNSGCRLLCTLGSRISLSRPTRRDCSWDVVVLLAFTFFQANRLRCA